MKDKRKKVMVTMLMLSFITTCVLAYQENDLGLICGIIAMAIFYKEYKK